MEWKDQGYGGQKGLVGLFATGAPYEIEVYRTPQAPHSLTAFSMTIQLLVGSEHRLQDQQLDLEFRYVVGGGGGHSLTVNKFEWSWLPASPSLPPSPPHAAFRVIDSECERYDV